MSKEKEAREWEVMHVARDRNAAHDPHHAKCCVPGESETLDGSNAARGGSGGHAFIAGLAALSSHACNASIYLRVLKRAETFLLVLFALRLRCFLSQTQLGARSFCTFFRGGMSMFKRAGRNGR